MEEGGRKIARGINLKQRPRFFKTRSFVSCDALRIRKLKRTFDEFSFIPFEE